ncbi:peptidoglycan-associated lipoprotein Pal [Chlorobium phaeovibrioides]|uniref:Peptidoglycan-associated lipoprotein n=1 Tax=Chlorobium phaeovibrioides TaxID=1094 RepID=A0A5M8IEU7_CHLPH|nr:peptidoglycan-associated lipoprotein Pal [Chlorobium phaeovibrioides]KAA6232829.1 peptidoglycan-associated lipoprotein Pal [Chlorobium phaeovibrioides]
MKRSMFLLKGLCVPAMLVLGACGCRTDVVAPEPVQPAPAPAAAPALGDVFYDFDQASIRMDAAEQLSQNAAWMQEKSSKRVVIEGHCDERGTSEYNMALGERRASMAKEYLVNLGVEPERMTTVSYGEERPFAAGSNEEAWALNRRAHFVEE